MDSSLFSPNGQQGDISSARGSCPSVPFLRVKAVLGRITGQALLIPI